MQTEKVKKPILKRKSFWIIAAAVLVVIILTLVTFLDYSIISAGIKIACKPGKMSEPKDFAEIKTATSAEYNLSYQSSYENGTFDIFKPAEETGKSPLVLYIHGGYYLGGDKKSAEPYCRALAAEGYTVVSMNYVLAPQKKYPAQLRQVNEILGYLVKNSDKYGIDSKKIYIGGDSAGAHLAAQAGVLYTNDTFAAKTKIERNIDGKNIKGLLLLCGFYNMDTVKECNFPFFDTAMWAFTDMRDYEKFSKKDELSIVEYVTDKYPEVFITCGDGDPFISQAKEMTEALKKNKVKFTEYFPESDGKLKHEFQRDFSTEEAHIALEKATVFLNGEEKSQTKVKGTHAIFTLLDGRYLDVLLDSKHAPTTVANFIKYAEAGFYNNTVFHRILENTVIQGGGYKYVDGKYVEKGALFAPIYGEVSGNGYLNNTIHHEAGVISMARTDDYNSATSQFFFCACDMEQWDGEYAAFGKIVNPEGIETVCELAGTGKGDVSYPSQPITIVAVTIKYDED